MKKTLKIIGIVIVSIIAALAGIALCVYLFVLQYPNLKENPTAGKWYRVADSGMKDSEGHSYHALFKKGNENKHQFPSFWAHISHSKSPLFRQE